MTHQLPRFMSDAALFCLLLACGSVLVGAEPLSRTTLSDPSLKFSVPVKPYVVLTRGDIEAVIVDNRAVDDDVLPGHKAGYSGVASLKHKQQARNLFVPTYAGLNFEHVIDGSLQDRTILFEPRNIPMELRVLNEHTAELYQAATPFYGVESCQRFELLEDGTIEFTVECIPRRRTWQHGYLLLFWASYIDQPESLDIHFLGHDEGQETSPRWIRGVTSEHGQQASHRALNDRRELAHADPFPLTLAFGFSEHRYAEPWYYGICRGMAFTQVFRVKDQIRLTQSPSGGGKGCPAWDFQWVIPDCQVNQRYQMTMRALYTPWSAGGEDQETRDILRRRVQAISKILATNPVGNVAPELTGY